MGADHFLLDATQAVKDATIKLRAGNVGKFSALCLKVFLIWPLLVRAGVLGALVTLSIGVTLGWTGANQALNISFLSGYAPRLPPQLTRIRRRHLF
jgi:hypothetical protein